MYKFGLLVCVLILASCSSSRRSLPFTDPDIKTIDYSNLKNWASHPDKFSFSDYIPKDQQPGLKKLDVDIFFLYPTTLTAHSNKAWNASIDDEDLNLKTDKSTIQFQCSVFNTIGKIYAPRYRQAHLRSYFSVDKESAKKALDLAYEDVKTAFLYYMEHLNKGRPFIIASHSQGTTHAKRLIKELIDGKPLQSKLIAAYLVGIPVLKTEFRTVKPCEYPDETGCFCSWRTVKEGYQPKWDSDPSAVAVINPVSWTTGLAKTDYSMQKGAILTDFNKTIQHCQTAQISNGVLWTNKPKFRGSLFYIAENYHVGDYNLFYVDIRDNARLRATQFLQTFQKN